MWIFAVTAINEDATLKLFIYKAGPQYFGRQIWGSCLYESDGKTSKKDIHSAIERLRKRNLKDLIFLTNFNYEGRVYDGAICTILKAGNHITPH